MFHKADECVRSAPKIFGHNLIAMSAVEIRRYQDFQKSVEADILKHLKGKR